MTERVVQNPAHTSFFHATEKMRELRKDEEKARRQRDNLALESAKRARATFLNECIAEHITTWKEAGIRATIGLDVEGLKIDIGAEGTHGIHSHLPYAFINDAAGEALVGRQKLLVTGFFNDIYTKHGTDEDGLDRAIMRDIPYFDFNEFELGSRVTKGEERTEVVQEWDRMLAKLCHDDIVSTYFSARGKRERENPRDEIADSLGGYPERVYGKQWLGKVSPEALRHYLTRDDKTGGAVWPFDRRVSRLTEVAELLSTRGSWENIRAYTDWQGLRLSYQGARHSRRMFESRRSQVQSTQMYESIKILGVLCSECTTDELSAHGVRMVKSPFLTGKGKRVDCIGIWTRYGFNRIFISPDDHVRSEGIPPEQYHLIPEISRVEFQGLEGLMAARTAFLDAVWWLRWNLNRKGDAEKKIRAVQELLFLIVSEIDERLYNETEQISQRTITALREEGTFQTEISDAYMSQLEKVDAWYTHTLVGQEPQAMLKESLTFPVNQVRKVVFDDVFYASMPPDMRMERSNELLRSLGFTASIFESPISGLPYAREQQAISSLKLERRPLILLTCGADNYSESAEFAVASDAYIDSLFTLALQYRANVISPGTQSTTLAMRLAKKYHTYLATLPLEERETARSAGARFFSIEPGKDTFVPGSENISNGGLHFDPEDAATAYPLVPLDAILTPYYAGWTKNGKGSEYRRHTHYRQTVARRLSEGQRVATVALNGGQWIAMENSAASRDGAQLILGSDMGRHSLLFSHLVRHGLEELKKLPDPVSFIAAVRTIVEATPQLAADTEIQVLVASESYMHELYELVLTADASRVSLVDAHTFASELERNLIEQRRVIDSQEVPLE